MRRVTAVIPASTANLGAGFDCLSLALGLYNRVEMEETETGLVVEIEGEGAGILPRDESHLTVRAAQQVFETAERRPAGLRIHATNRIPLASGLGSSSAAVVGGLVGANSLIEAQLSHERLLDLAYSMEGHADNAAASLYGGLVILSQHKGGWLVRRIPTSDLKITVALPSIGVSTEEMRRGLPRQVPLADAVFNIGRSLLTVEALRQGDLVLLGMAIGDRLHEPYRKAFIPGFDDAVQAAKLAGAAAVALSGAGPSVVAFSESDHGRIGQAMVRAFQEAGLEALHFVAAADLWGVQVTVDD